ncbi:GTPase [Succinimonas amylolytica]|uniref:GTPase n=1 Tax=Succinimonas amylolytica TaxID=83769 RepID=UPI0023A7C1A7
MGNSFGTDNENDVTNVLLLGKTGVGKSALLNYLFGENIVRSGSGAPVTSRGIHPQPPFRYGRMMIRIYDSWGLEPGDSATWKSIIEQEIGKTRTASVEEWFHTIIYCVDAQKSRLDDFEIQCIIRPLLDDGNQIVFVLTKADIAGAAKLAAVQKVITEEFPGVMVFPVGSVEARLRNGTVKKPMGREPLLRHFAVNLRRNLINQFLRNSETLTAAFISSAHQRALAAVKRELGMLGTASYRRRFRKFLEDAISREYQEASRALFGRMNLDLETINRISFSVFENFRGEVISFDDALLPVLADGSRVAGMFRGRDLLLLLLGGPGMLVLFIRNLFRSSHYLQETEKLLGEADARLRDESRRFLEAVRKTEKARTWER